MASSASEGVKPRTVKPPVAFTSSKPMWASRSSATRMGVRDIPNRATSGSSETRSPGASSPQSSSSRTLKKARAVCEATSDDRGRVPAASMVETSGPFCIELPRSPVLPDIRLASLYARV